MHINLNFIFVCDATTHLGSPCSQSNAASCDPAQLSCPVQQEKCSRWVRVQRQHWGNPNTLILPALLQPRPIQLICRGVQVGLLRECGKSSTFPCCRAQSLTASTPSAGAGGAEKLCWRPCQSQVFPKIWTSGLNPTEITVPEGRKNVY